MAFSEQLLLVLGLSLDGFAGSVCMGVAAGGKRGRQICSIVWLVSGLHVAMLLGGHWLGLGCRSWMRGIYPWMAALLLTLLGINMLRQFSKEDNNALCELSWASVAALSFATSLDAVTVGAALALMEVPAWQAGTLTAVVTGGLSLVGALFGKRIGSQYRRDARLAGGVIVLLVGLRLALSAATGQ